MTNPYDPHNANNPDPQQPKDVTPEVEQGTPDFGSYHNPPVDGAESSSATAASSASSETPYSAYDPNAAGAAGYAGQAGYGGAAYDNTGWATADERKNAVAPWALGVGIVAIVAGVSIVGSGFAFVPGLIGLILGIIAVVKARGIQGPGRRMGMSITSIILSILSIVAAIAFWVIAYFVITETGIADCLSIQDPAAQQACLEDVASNASNSVQ